MLLLRLLGLGVYRRIAREVRSQLFDQSNQMTSLRIRQLFRRTSHRPSTTKTLTSLLRAQFCRYSIVQRPLTSMYLPGLTSMSEVGTTYAIGGSRG